MGVRRAVETTLDVIQKEGTGVSTYGPLIHNPQVLNLLEERGVKILQDIPEKESGTVIIRAHGVPPVHKEKLQLTGATVKDATCPHVVKVQVVIKKYLKHGYATIIIGDRNHAEVEGLMGFAGSLGKVVSNREDVQSLQLHVPYIIVSQTTQDETSFEELSSLILERFPGGKVFNTICDATHKRQEEVRSLCNDVDAMVVVGGLGSIFGSIAGACLLSWLDLELRNILSIPYLGGWLEALSMSYFSITGVSNIQLIVYGSIMVAIMLFEPLGIYGIWIRTKLYWKTWPF